MLKLFLKQRRRRQRIKQFKQKAPSPKKLHRANLDLQVANVKWQRANDATRYISSESQYFEADLKIPDQD